MTPQEVFEALSAPGLRAGLFVEVRLADGPIRVFSGIGEATTPDGLVWVGMGGVGRISAIETTEKIEAQGFSIGFQLGADMIASSFDTLMAAFTEARKTDVKRKEVFCNIGVFDDTGRLIDDRLILWGSGVGSHLTVSTTRASMSMTLQCEGRLTAAFPPNSEFLTDRDQKARYPGDRGCEGVGPLASGNKQAIWKAGV